MRKLAVLFVAVLGLSTFGLAQNTEISAGYNHLTGDIGKNGFYASAGYLPFTHVGVEGEFGAYYGSRGPVTDNAYTYLFGPKVMTTTHDGLFTPFAHLLLGGAHESNNYFGWLLGGGVDIGSKQLALRLKLDAVRFNSDTHARVGIGGVYRW